MRKSLLKIVPALMLMLATLGLGQDAVKVDAAKPVLKPAPVQVIKSYPASTAKPQLIAWQQTSNPYAVVAPRYMPGDGWYDATWIGQDINARLGGYGPVILMGYDRRLLDNAADYVKATINGKECSVWSMSFDNGIAETVEGVRLMARTIKATGARVTMWVGDGEAARCNWNLSPESMIYLRDLPRYQAFARAFGLPKDPTQLDAAGVVKFNAELGRIQDNVRKLAVYDVLEEEFPGVPFGDFGNHGVTPDDAKAAPDLNNWPQYAYKSAGTVYSPVAYAYVANLQYAQPELLKPMPCLGYQINLLLAAWRADGSKPVWPWLAGRNLGNVLDPTYFSELWKHALVMNGGHALLFNHEIAAEDEKIILDACVSFEKAAAGRSGGHPYTDKLANVKGYCHVSTWVYPDGGSLSRVTFQPGGKPTTVSILGQVIPVAPEDGAGCWRYVAAKGK